MKFVVVDVQGFNVPEFQAKELAIYDGNQMKNYLFKPLKPFHDLPTDCKKQVLFLYGNRHGLYYNNGKTDYSELYTIIYNDLRDVDLIYVKGHVKKDFLVQIYLEMKYKAPHIVNLEFARDSANVPKLVMTTTDCPYHSLDVCSCSVKNAYTLYEYIYNFLPK